MDDQASEPALDPAPDPNLVLAQQNQNESEALVECPKCHHQRRTFVIIDGECDSCRTRGQAAQIVNQLGWPEVRQRRNMLIADSDHTQLADRAEDIQKAHADWRQQLRDVTDQDDPLKAWYKLDELQANRPTQ